MVLKSTILGSAICGAMFASSTYGHSMMTNPPANWGPNHPWGTNSPSGIVDGRPFIPYPDGIPEWEHTSGFIAYFKKQTKYKSVYELILDLYKPEEDKECGVTQKVGTPQVLGDYVSVQTQTHPGPCEIWCDDVMVFQEMRCSEGQYATNMPVDKAKCAGAKTVKWVWLALHVVDYQAYINCATLQSSGPSPTTAIPTTAKPTTAKPMTPVPTTEMPPTSKPPTSPPVTTATPPSGGIACNYQGQTFNICRTSNLDAWSYENGAPCVGITRCVKQSPPYGVISKSSS